VTELADQSDWEKAASIHERLLLFKHSTTCPISAAAYREVSAFSSGAPVPVYMVKVIESRPLSLWLAETLAVRHASPQVILVENGRAVWNTSHYDITASTLKQACAARSG
jgi:bacillithiol system protein YtxJ